MGALSLDNEFQEYWSKLTVVQKELMLDMAKNYVQMKEEKVKYSATDIEEFHRRLDDHANGSGKTFTIEESFNKARAAKKRV